MAFGLAENVALQLSRRAVVLVFTETFGLVCKRIYPRLLRSYCRRATESARSHLHAFELKHSTSVLGERDLAHMKSRFFKTISFEQCKKCQTEIF